MAEQVGEESDQNIPTMSQSVEALENIEGMSLKLFKAIRAYRKGKTNNTRELDLQNEVLQCELNEMQDNKEDDPFEEISEKCESEVVGVKQKDEKINACEDLCTTKSKGDSKYVKETTKDDGPSTSHSNHLSENLFKLERMQGKDPGLIKIIHSMFDKVSLEEHHSLDSHKNDLINFKNVYQQLHKKYEISERKQEQLQSDKYQTEVQLEELEAEVARLQGQIQARDVVIKDLEREMVKIQMDSDEKHAQVLQLHETHSQFLKNAISNEIQFLMAEEMQCAICTEFFEKAVTLGCSHTFCEKCLSALTDQLCPVCRQQITFKVATPAIDSLLQKIAASYPDPTIRFF